MICSKRGVGASQKGLHLADVGRFAVNELLCQIFNLAVMVRPLVHVFNTLDHAPGIAQNHHIRHQPFARLKFRQIPSSLGSQGMGLTFDGIIFLQLGFQGFAQAGPHGGIQNTSDANLPHLCGF